MFKKKLSNEDLEELRKRTELINQYSLITEGLRIQHQIYLRNILPKYNCDMNKNYNINLKTGEITEIPIQDKGRLIQNIPQ